jgi:hypothetical protein
MPQGTASDEPLKGERFELKPKPVRYAKYFKDRTGLVFPPNAPEDSPPNELENDLNEIIECLGAGRYLPPRFYRRGIDRTPDQLLEDHGIKHLHLGAGNSDVLVFAVEFDDHVLLLEVSDHSRFGSKPHGTALRSLHDTCMAEAGERAAAEREKSEKAEAERRKKAAGGLRPRRPR